jgi:hypothetical protein
VTALVLAIVGCAAPGLILLTAGASGLHLLLDALLR